MVSVFTVPDGVSKSVRTGHRTSLYSPLYWSRDQGGGDSTALKIKARSVWTKTEIAASIAGRYLTCGREMFEGRLVFEASS